MTENKVKQASTKAHTLDDATQHTLEKVRKSNNKALMLFIVSWSVLLGLALFGLYKQYQIARQSQDHIDCIIKDLSTPPPTNASPNAKKYIDYQSRLTADCRIKFTN